jgi:hypothetical protein
MKPVTDDGTRSDFQKEAKILLRPVRFRVMGISEPKAPGDFLRQGCFTGAIGAFYNDEHVSPLRGTKAYPRPYLPTNDVVPE